MSQRGRPPGVQGRETAREAYYKQMALKTQLENRRRQGELVEVAEIRAAWADVVLPIREALLSLASALVQHGWLRPEHEPAVQAHVDAILTELSQGRGGARSRFTPPVDAP